MAPMTEAFQTAIAHHRAGQLREAETVYRQIIAADPHHADAFHMLGLLANQAGHPGEAVEFIQQAIRLRGSDAVFHFNLGGIYQAQGQAEAAIACYRQATRLQPSLIEAHLNLGTALNDRGRGREAVACFEAALAIQPDSPAALFMLGVALHGLQDWDAAAAAYRAVIRLQSEHVDAMVNLSDVLRAQNQLDEASAWCRRAIELRADLVEAHNNLGVILSAQRRFEEAAASYRRALELRPDHVELLRNLGALLRNQNQFDQAEVCYRRIASIDPENAQAQCELAALLERQGKLDEARLLAERTLEIDPNYADGHAILGAIWQQHGQIDEALAAYERAIALDPSHAEYRFLRSTIWLMRGDMARGWPEFETRLNTQFAVQPHPQPRWNGSDLKGDRILIHHEWGLGDLLQFVRYVPLVVERGGEVVLEVPSRLVPLLESSGYQNVYAMGDPAMPACQWQIPIFSLPGVFHTTIATIPAVVPYLAVPEEAIARWRERLRAYPGFKVGIHWHSDRKAPATGTRSMPLDEFEPLARVDGVTLVSLQKSFPANRHRGLADTFDVVDFGDELDVTGAFVDTAAIMKNLDLVITCDTSTVHVAGGLGVPVWVALSFAGEFRWLLNRNDSPWYPTLRLFRQPRLGDWTSVFAEMATELAKLVPGDRSHPGVR